MFTLQDDIFRASKAGQPLYADVSARVDAYYEDFDKVFVDGFDYIYKSYMGYRPGGVTGRVAGAK